MEFLTDQQRSIYLQFIEITNCSVPENEEQEQKLIKFLSFYDWILESCIGNFFENDGSLEVSDRPNADQAPLPPRPASLTNNSNPINSHIPSSANPMINEFLTRMRFPQVLPINNDVISENMTVMMTRRSAIDRTLGRYGYHKPSDHFTTNLGRFASGIKNSNTFFFFLWPIVTVLDFIWRGISYFLGLQFLFGESKSGNQANTAEREVIVPLPYFKFTDQLDLINKSAGECRDDGGNEKQDENEDSLMSLYDKQNFSDPTFEQVLAACNKELVPELANINMGKVAEIQYDCKIKSNLLFYIILNDSFNVLSPKQSLGSQRSEFLLMNILPSKELSDFLKEKEQAKILLGDVAYQVASWAQIKSMQGTQTLPSMVVMAKVDGLLSLLGKVNLLNISKPSHLIKKINTFIDKFDVSLGLSLQRYELLELEYSRNIKDMQDQEFEKTLKADEAKQAKKDTVNLKHLEYMRFAVKELLEAKDEGFDMKPCQLQIKMLDGSRIVLKLNPEQYTVQKLYNLLNVLQYLGVTNSIAEQDIRTMLTDKVENCILDPNLQIFKTNDEEDIEELDELEIEIAINKEILRWSDKLRPFEQNEDFIQLDESNDSFPSKFSIVSPFPRKLITRGETFLKDSKDLYPRANLIIETIEADSESEEERDY